MIKRIFWFFLGAAIPFFIAWCGGADLSQRTPGLGFIVAVSIVLALSFGVGSEDPKAFKPHSCSKSA